MFPPIVNWTLCLLLVVVSVVVAEDYYNLLGISKDADNREIRRAYKKLALLYHPDKNKNNEEIQEKFVRISKAYEVLKDTETRRKYDQFGEAGLDDSHSQNHHYQSWSYFENFGIYDDDPEIITLSDSEFSQSVQGRSDVWFINFYSPMCSHCHHLAPVWRKVAQELLGVVRIGAVNCGEEWSLCRQQGIHSYPTLKLYPKEMEYRGGRTSETLVDFVLDSISSKYIKLTKKNLDQYLKDPSVSKLSWLIFVCNQGSDCPSETTQLKLSVMLRGMVNVAIVNHDPDFASVIAETPGVLYYEPGKVIKDSATNIFSNDAQEIFRTVLLMLPQIEEVIAISMADLSTSMESQHVAQLLCFFSDKEMVDQSLNELPFLLSSVKVSRVNCDKSIGICNELHIHKFPAFVVLKPRGKYEVYHGRVSPRDVAAFVEDSLSSTVESLGPNDFPTRVINSGEPWFVDFYAPWCPPCLRLLPEWRRASQEIGDVVHFGTVDCTIHHALCSQYKIHSYPTTVLYNQTVPHKYDGQRNFMDIVEFVKDTLSPSVISLTTTSFEKLIEGRSTNEIWVVDFFAPWCGPCQQLSIQWRKLAKLVSGVFHLHVASLDCTVHSELCDSQGIRSYPTIRLYPTGGQPYITYGSYSRDVHSLRAWVYRYLPSRVVTLDNNDFYNKVIYSRERWIIDFYAPWCGHCEMFAPEFESVAQDLGDEVKAAKVNCDILQYVCNEAGIRAYPSVRFYPGSRKSQPQSVHGIDVHSQDKDTIITFVKNWLRTSKTSDNLEDNEILRERDEL